MNLKRNLGDTVRRYRLELGLSQVQLAERMGSDIQQADISRIERGYIPWPRPDLLTSLARGLDMGPIELITLSGWMSRDELRHYRSFHAPAIQMPLAILGSSNESIETISSTLSSHFRTLAAFDGRTLLTTITAHAPDLVVVSDDCPHLRLEELETALDEHLLSSKVIVVGTRRSAVPRDLRFHYLKAPATPSAMGSLLGAMGYSLPSVL
jgi:transcriptional regulator with XRE-family HTH domain